MAKGKGVGVKGSRRRRVIQRDEDSEESDEEYKVTEDEEGDESDEYSFDGEESEELLDGFEKSRRVARSRKTRRGSSGRKRNKTTKPRKRRKIVYKEDNDDDEEEEDVAYEEDEEIMSWGRKAKQVKKPTEKKKVSFTEVDDEEEVADEDVAELTTFGRKTNQTKKPPKKKRASYKESDDDDEYNGDSDDNGDDEEDDYAELVSPRIKRSRRKKHDEDDDEMEDEDEDEDDEEPMSLGKKANQIRKPSEKDAVSYTGLDDDDDDDEEYAEHESSSRKRNQRNKSRENMSIVFTEDEYEDEDEDEDVDVDVDVAEVEDEDDDMDEYVDEDDDGSMYSGRKANRKRKLRKKRGVSYTEGGDEDGFGFISTRKKANQIKEPREENTVSYKDDDQEEEEDDERDVEFKLSESDFVDDEDDSPKTQKSDNQIKEPREENTVSYKDDNQEEEDDDETDVEFKLSESDFVDDEDDSPKIQKSEKVNRSHPQKKTVRGRRSKSKKPKSKNSTKSKQRNLRSGRKLGSSKENKNQVEKQSKKRKPRVRADSDSDFVSSASSHHDLTLSEEEREQVREAEIYCAKFKDNSRSSSCGNEEEPAREQRKYLLRKGKEKIEDVKDETGKQVCGICLSEEAKRTVRGVLNCCQHYFCFSCIMEWSKVESRCPLCKQRFATITKAAKSDTAFALRTVVIPVPECDQVYQPSEEELRGYLDPYENVMCTECQRGGDDALMLLCDICDSSAHTFCVGLGREVPEGNWYCDGCRPTVFSSLNSQLPTPTSERRLSSNVSDLSSPIAGGFDLNEAYVPETPLTQQAFVFPEPRLPVNDFLAGPTGTGATTLRDRRWIRRQIHHRLWNNNRMSGTSPSSSGVRLFGSQLEQTVAQPHASFNRREDHNNDIMSSLHDVDFFSSRADQFSVEVQNSNLASLDMSLQGENGASGMAFDSRTGYPQLHPCTNRANITTDACREVIGPSRTSHGGFHAPY